MVIGLVEIEEEKSVKIVFRNGFSVLVEKPIDSITLFFIHVSFDYISNHVDSVMCQFESNTFLIFVFKDIRYEKEKRVSIFISRYKMLTC